jgi:hypothetical protein
VQRVAASTFADKSELMAQVDRAMAAIVALWLRRLGIAVAVIGLSSTSVDDPDVPGARSIMTPVDARSKRIRHPASGTIWACASLLDAD